MYCDRCGSPVTGVFPVEPLFTMKSSALLVPVTLDALRKAVRVHAARLKPPLYRWRDGTRPRKRVRYLYASDIRALREIYFSEERHPGRSSTAVQYEAQAPPAS